MKRLVFLTVLVGSLTSCATTDEIWDRCYLGVIDKESEAYAQLCFSKPPDNRGELLFYTKNLKVNKLGGRAVVCRQKFSSVSKEDRNYLRVKLARCGHKDSKADPLRGRAIAGMRFRSDIEYCQFLEEQKLVCKRKGAKGDYTFTRLRSES